jgi:hypothetical protein
MAGLRSTGSRLRSSVAAAGCRTARTESGSASAPSQRLPRSVRTRSVAARSSADIWLGESTADTPRSAGTDGRCITERRQATTPRGHRPHRMPRRPERRRADTKPVWCAATPFLDDRPDRSGGVRQSRQPAVPPSRRARPPAVRPFDSRGIRPSPSRRPRWPADDALARPQGDHSGRRSWRARTTTPRPAASAEQAAIAAWRWLRLDAGKCRRTQSTHSVRIRRDAPPDRRIVQTR